MDFDLFRLLLGTATLAATVMAAVGVLRRRLFVPFALVASGLLGILFFASMPNWPFAGVMSALLLAVVGFLVAPAPDSRDFAESTQTRSR